MRQQVIQNLRQRYNRQSETNCTWGGLSTRATQKTRLRHRETSKEMQYR
jgi:hypothetical protein